MSIEYIRKVKNRSIAASGLHPGEDLHVRATKIKDTSVLPTGAAGARRSEAHVSLC